MPKSEFHYEIEQNFEVLSQRENEYRYKVHKRIKSYFL